MPNQLALLEHSPIETMAPSLRFVVLLLICPALSVAAEFSADDAKVWAALSQISYCSASQSAVEAVMNWTCEPCKASGVEIMDNKVRFANWGDLWDLRFAYVARLSGPESLKGKCLVSVRGSHNIGNWVENLATLHHHVDFPDCNGCSVESGFNDVWEQLKRGVQVELADLGCGVGTGNKVILTGHSLGGAVATLGMMSLHARGFAVEPAMTFEAPRVGNAAFREEFEKVFDAAGAQFYRVTRARDPVPLVPFEWMGYLHVGKEAYFDDNDKVTICDDGSASACSGRNSFAIDLLHTGDHCASHLVPSGSICGCPGFSEDLTFAEPVSMNGQEFQVVADSSRGVVVV